MSGKNRIVNTMAALKMMSLNTGNTLVLGGLLSLIRLEHPDIIFLQEITVTSGQLKLYVAKYGYSAEANTDLLDITSLGTGIIWKSHIPVTDVTSVVHCRVQSAKLGPYNLLNIYAPSGSNNKQQEENCLVKISFVWSQVPPVYQYWQEISTPFSLLWILREIMLRRNVQLCLT